MTLNKSINLVILQMEYQGNTSGSLKTREICTVDYYVTFPIGKERAITNLKLKQTWESA